jgi:hypothetical protein
VLLEIAFGELYLQKPYFLFAKWHPAFIDNKPNVNSRSPMASKIVTFQALNMPTNGAILNFDLCDLET